MLPELGRDRYALASAEKTVIADIVLRAAEAAGGKSIIVAGYDVGGMIAFACARDRPAKLAAACERAVLLKACNYRSVRALIVTAVTESGEQRQLSLVHENVRGSDYFH